MRSNVIRCRGAPVWNDDPIGGEIVQATATVIDTRSRVYTFDVSGYVNTQRADGHDVVSFMIQAGAVTSSSIIDFNSKEASSGKPALVLSESGPSVATPAAASPSTVTGTTTSLSVLGADPDGESSLTYTWWTVSQPTGGSLSVSATGTNAAKDVTAYFDEPGTYAMYAVITDPEENSISSNTLTFTVVATLASIAVTPTPVTMNENATQQFAASGLDQFGVALASQPTFTWSNSGVGSVNSTGLYTAPGSTGSATVTAASGSVSGNASVTVGNAAPTVATAAAASPSPVTGTTASLSALGADDGGESNLTYTWTTTSIPSGATAPAYSANDTNAAKNDTATFTSAGAYTFMVTITDLGGLYATSNVSVTVNQTLTSISVTPGTATVGSDGTQQFAASALDQFGVALATQPTFTWTNSGSGSVDGTGLYTAPASSGSDAVTAASGGVSGNASVTIAELSVVQAASADPVDSTPGLGVLGALGSEGGSPTLTYTWAVSSAPSGAPAVSFGDNGDSSSDTTLFNYGAAGTYGFEVTISDGVNSVTSGVTFVVSQQVTSIVVTPGGAAVVNGESVQFAATAYDQFGNAITDPGTTWSAASGTFGGTGDYTAPSVGTGRDTVTASAGGATATALVEYGANVGTVYEDDTNATYSNGYDSADEGYNGLDGWEVYLDQSGNEPSTTTDINGNYALPAAQSEGCGCGAGSTVALIQQSGFTLESPADGNIPVAAGATNAGLDFFLAPPAQNAPAIVDSNGNALDGTTLPDAHVGQTVSVKFKVLDAAGNPTTKWTVEASTSNPNLAAAYPPNTPLTADGQGFYTANFTLVGKTQPNTPVDLVVNASTPNIASIAKATMSQNILNTNWTVSAAATTLSRSNAGNTQTTTVTVTATDDNHNPIQGITVHAVSPHTADLSAGLQGNDDLDFGPTGNDGTVKFTMTAQVNNGQNPANTVDVLFEWGPLASEICGANAKQTFTLKP